MNKQELKSILQQGEGLKAEFKETLETMMPVFLMHRIVGSEKNKSFCGGMATGLIVMMSIILISLSISWFLY